jgi:hypothetical protein
MVSARHNAGVQLHQRVSISVSVCSYIAVMLNKYLLLFVTDPQVSCEYALILGMRPDE